MPNPGMPNPGQAVDIDTGMQAVDKSHVAEVQNVDNVVKEVIKEVIKEEEVVKEVVKEVIKEEEVVKEVVKEVTDTQGQKTESRLAEVTSDVDNIVNKDVTDTEKQKCVWTGHGNPAANQKLSCWEPEDEEFWETWGKRIAWKNLLISIPNLSLGFATWLMWSVVATTLQAAHDDDSNAYMFKDLDLSPTDTKGWKANIFMLPALAGLSGATCRVVNTFMVAIAGGQMPNAMNTTLTIIPMMGIGLALAKSNCPFWVLSILAPASGLGGGAFSSSMSSISFFFPKRKQGFALGMNAGFGNLGVSVTQLVVPQICSVSLIGIGVIGSKYVANSGWFYVILCVLAAIPAWVSMNYMPTHGSQSGSTLQNWVSYMRLQSLAFPGIGLSVVLFLASQPIVKGNAPLVIIRIFLLACIACGLTGVCLWFLSGQEIQDKLRTQAVIFKNKHTFWFTILYIMTFGSFIGYSSAFPLIIKNVFGYLPNGEKNPNAPSVGAYAWMGACVGSLSRVAGGILSDKFGKQGGAIVTHWGTVIEIIATVVAGVLVRFAVNADTPETWFAPFLITFLVLFGATGSSNGSTFRQMSVSYPPEQAGPVLGWTSTVAAYGAAVFTACFGAGVKGDFVDIVLYAFAGYYFLCLLINYWFYYRWNAEKPC